MLLVMAVLLFVLAGIYTSTQVSVQRLSETLLHQVIDDRSFYGSSRPGLDRGAMALLPYFTVTAWETAEEEESLSVYVTGGTYEIDDDSEELRTLLEECMRLPERSGMLKSHSLRYLREDRGLYTRFAFVDTSMEQTLLRLIMVPYLFTAAIALVVLLLISLLLSYLVTRPVEKSWRQQRQFLSDASHELKTPLTVILSNAELLSRSALPEKETRWVGNIRSESESMRSLVEQMLTLARADNMVSTAVMEELDLSELAEESVMAFEALAFEAGKPLIDEIAPDVRVSGDGKQLRQLLAILLDNAVKYGADDRPIRLTLTADERAARLTVANQGTPIPPKQLKRLFERFYRADDSRGEKEGFGLGLPIAMTIAKTHKATLKAESDERSTRFIFTIPRRSGARAKKESAPAPASEQDETPCTET